MRAADLNAARVDDSVVHDLGPEDLLEVGERSVGVVGSSALEEDGRARYALDVVVEDLVVLTKNPHPVIGGCPVAQNVIAVDHVAVAVSQGQLAGHSAKGVVAEHVVRRLDGNGFWITAAIAK